MVEPQLVDYINKARSAKQTDEQSRSLLIKNGWTEEEVNEAFSSLGQPAVQTKPQQQMQPQPKSEPQTKSQPRPQLVDYINKARQDGTSDAQSRSFLRKNGWTEEELDSAFTAAEPAPAQPDQTETRPQVSGQPQIKTQPETASQPQVQYQPQQTQPKYETRPARRGGAVRLISKLFIVLILLAIIGAGIYFAIGQKNLLNSFLDKILSFSTQKTAEPAPVVENKKEEPAPVLTLVTQKIATILPEYDISKITVAAFSQAGDKVVYCAPKKVGGVISCFSNAEKLFDSPYSFKPYWIGISPDGKRVVFLYLDPVKKQSFVFENNAEGTRYDGTITSPKFSDDSKSFVYMVMGKDNKNFVVLNGKASTPHDKIYTVPEFSSDGRYIIYGARDGQDLFWVADQVNPTGQ